MTNLPLNNTTYIDKIYSCPTCNKIPFISFLPSSPVQIQLTCHCCFQTQIISIKDFLSMTSTEPNIIEVNEHTPPKYINNCTKHLDSKNDFFCYDCFDEFCAKCKEYHKTHCTCNIEDKSIGFNIHEIIERHKVAKDIMKKNLKEIKDAIVKTLKDEINEVESRYKECKQRNNELLSSLTILINNYLSNNRKKSYVNIINLKNNSNVNRSEIEENDYYLDDVKFAIRLFTNYNLINIEPKNDQVINIHTFTEHKKDITSLLLLNENRLLSCGLDTYINVYNLNTFKVDFVIPKAHSSTIFHLAELITNKIISCSKDQTVKIWSISNNSYNLEQTIQMKSIIKRTFSIINYDIGCFTQDCKFGILTNESNYTSYKGIDNLSASYLLPLRDKHTVVGIKDKNTFIIYCILSKEKKEVVLEQLSDFTIGDLYEFNNKRIGIFTNKPKSFLMLNIESFMIESTLNFPDIYRWPSNHHFCFCESNNDSILCTTFDGVYKVSKSTMTIRDFDSYEQPTFNHDTKYIVSLNGKTFCAAIDRRITIFEW